MSIKIKLKEILAVNEFGGTVHNQINYELLKLINLPVKNGGLKYDLQTKLGKAVNKEFDEYTEARLKYGKEMAVEKEIELANGRVYKTQNKIAEVKDKTGLKLLTDSNGFVKKINGKDVGNIMMGEMNVLDITADKKDEFDKHLSEMIENEIELSCHPIKLSRLIQYADCSELDFSVLEKFIIDDRGEDAGS